MAQLVHTLFCHSIPGNDERDWAARLAIQSQAFSVALTHVTYASQPMTRESCASEPIRIKWTSVAINGCSKRCALVRRGEEWNNIFGSQPSLLIAEFDAVYIQAGSC